MYKGKIYICMHISLYVKLNAVLDNIHTLESGKNKSCVFFWFTYVNVCPCIFLGKQYPD